jgi:Ni,Fe-hydrogenase III large subunit
MRVSCKHRGIEKRYERMTGGDGVLLAERTEGIAAVAHVLAFCQAAERIAGCQPARTAGPGPAAARRARADRQPS